MDHQLGPTFASCTASQPRHFHTQYLKGRRYHASLNPAYEILVPIDHPQGSIKVDTTFGDDIGNRSQSGLADMKEGNNFCMTVRQDMPRETLKGGAARTTRVHQRRD